MSRILQWRRGAHESKAQAGRLRPRTFTAEDIFSERYPHTPHTNTHTQQKSPQPNVFCRFLSVWHQQPFSNFFNSWMYLLALLSNNTASMKKKIKTVIFIYFVWVDRDRRHDGWWFGQEDFWEVWRLHSVNHFSWPVRILKESKSSQCE